MNKLFLIVSLLILSMNFSIAQNIINGVVYDNASGESMPFVDILIQGTTNGGATDLNGAYELKVEPGIHNVVFKFLGYSDLIIEGIEVVEGDVVLLNVELTEDSERLAEVVVKVKQAGSTESAILTLETKSASFIKGSSNQGSSTTGNSDGTDIIKRIPGFSVAGQKHVFVRGLSNRYTKTTLNGIDIPGLDPDKNTVQMDIFPASIIDNIAVYKTFVPNLPGDFSGGLLDIITKDFPSTSSTSISLKTGYNAGVHLNDKFVTYDGGKTDWLAIDDGGRELPFNEVLPIPDPVDPNNNFRLEFLTSSLNPTLSVKEQSQFLDRKFSFSHGNHHAGKKSTIGYVVALNYAAEYNFDEDAKYGDYRKNRNKSINGLERTEIRSGPLSTAVNAWSGLAGLSLKFDKNKIGLIAMRNQNGVSTTAKFTEVNSGENPAKLFYDILQYSQREVTSVQLSGKHIFGEGNLTAAWKLSSTFSRVYEPDIRSSAFELTKTGDFQINSAVGAFVTRDWRELKEQNNAAKFDLEYNFSGIKGRSSKMSFGGYFTTKVRDYQILSYNLLIQNQKAIEFSGDKNEILQPQNILTLNAYKGVYLQGNFEPSNSYEANQYIAAAYLMGELPLSSKVKTVFGARIEKVQNKFTGQNTNRTEFLNDEVVLDETDILPSVSLIYNVKEHMNLSLSYASTLARPTFEEKSMVRITDRISNRVFTGNLDLVETLITNYDFVWDYTFGNSELFSAGVFYKNFKNPLELTAFNSLTPNEFTTRNVDEATMLGLEIEGRKSLDFLSLPNFSLQSNVTFISSSVNMNPIEFASRQVNARDGEFVDDKRDLAGQSNFVINAALNYAAKDRGWNFNLNFDIRGERLAIVGIGSIPDVYEQPFESLNFELSKHLKKHFKITLEAINLLDADREFLYKSYSAESRLFSRFAPGRLFSFGISYGVH